MKPSLLPLLALLTVACVTEKSFPQTAAKSQCQWQETCYKANFDATYASVGECTDYLGGLLDCGRQHCDSFDAKAAQDCLTAVREQDCSNDTGSTDDDATFQDCLSAWTDCDAIGLAACVVSATSAG